MYQVDLKDSFFPAQSEGAWEPQTIPEMLESCVQKWGDVHALRELGYDGEVGREWTYRELQADSKRMSNALASRHQQGAKVAIYANNIPEWVIFEYAASMAGLVLVTVNPSYQVAELKYVLEQSGSEAVYFVEDYRGNPMGDIVRKATADMPAVKHLVDLNNTTALYEGSEKIHNRIVRHDDAVQIQYTSGTTGFPKGALLHHNGLIKNGRDCLGRIGTKPGDHIVHFMPMFHTTGCAMMVLGGMSVGHTVNISPIFDPVMLVNVIEREKPRMIFGVPTMLVALLEVTKATGKDLTFVERLCSGGSMVSPELCREVREVFDAPLNIVYGQTEASPVITQTYTDDAFEDLTQTIGQPLPDMDVAILETGSNKVLPIGEQGEICSRGYNVMHGYNDNPEATAAAIDKDGWLHTGDLGTMDARGYIKITGRVKEMIIRGGENLFPVEIENAIQEHEDVAEIAVVGVADAKMGEEVACFMRSGTGNKPDNAAMKAFVRERLSPQKTPRYWFWVEDWPLTGSGKIRKFKLAEMFEAGEFS